MAIGKVDPSDNLAKLDKNSFGGIDSPLAKELRNDSFFSAALGQKSKVQDDPKKQPYASKTAVAMDSGVPAVKTAIEKFAPKADDPTTAAADPGLDINKAIQQVDPMGKAQVFANMVKQFNLIKSIMNIAGGSSGGGAPSAPQKTIITDSLSGALCILANQYTYQQVIDAFNTALEKNGINSILPDYQDIVKNALASLIEKAILFGEDNIPKPIVPPIYYGEPVPEQLTDTVPDLYLKQYYTGSTDPYIGYIQWLSNDYTKTIYTKRTVNDPPYESMDDEIKAISEQELAADLAPYIENNILTTSILNILLPKQNTNINNNGMDRALGKNTSSNLMSNLTQLLGIVGTAVNLAQSLHLPNSVLNSGSITTSMTNFSKSMGMLKTMQQASGQIFSPAGGLGGALSGLGAISSLAGQLGALGVSIPSLNSALGGTLSGGLGQITSALNSVAGISNYLSASGVSVSSLTSGVAGATTSISSISSAMSAAGSTVSSVASTANLLRNMGI